ncbi:SulP family inorganic anion transporter [Aeoliella sp. ICT_H6.2]|uniref:SulP family inorganic anion transporter n=1 Tax=Aeoliella straminimaris TaxID=2954799 RepID=A0A9X2FBX5_9BACT|nr:SulP family inorganic anion transporter [Aeoliella straminimaris]MCO6045408.1 SulP family inorganic anion transporter [Aeoliella straminimaris]
MLDLFAARPQNLKNDVLSGLTVALALVPEAVAFAFLAGVSPIMGLYSAFFIGLITAIVGGRPGMISGATGAMAVVVVSLVAMHGVEYLFPAVVLCGVIQILVGSARLGMLIRMVPHPVMLGFVNGLAIVILLAQFGSFKTVSNAGHLAYMRGPALWIMLGLVALTMSIIWLLPKLTRAVPASLAAILVVTGISVAMNNSLSTELAAENQSQVVLTVGDMLMTNAKAQAAAEVDPSLAAGNHTTQAPASTAPSSETTEAEITAAMAGVNPESVSLSAGLPRPFFLEYALPPLTLATLWIILPYAVTLAGVGLIESLMTLSLIDDITETRGQGNRECVGQGVANIVCGLFGGMGGCAMIGQSLINVNSGGRGRLSGVTAAVCLLLFVLFLAPWIEMIPMAALVGVMFMVVIGTFEWASLRMARKVPVSDYAVMILVAGYTVLMHDLATAVVLGVIASALVFAWQHAKHIGVDVKHNEFGSKIYQLHGPLFFASTSSFKDLFDPKNDPEDVVIDFYYTRVYDQSGLEAISSLAERYEAAGKRLHLTHLSNECRRLLDRAGDLVEVNLSEDPQYHVATDRIEPLMVERKEKTPEYEVSAATAL